MPWKSTERPLKRIGDFTKPTFDSRGFFIIQNWGLFYFKKSAWLPWKIDQNTLRDVFLKQKQGNKFHILQKAPQPQLDIKTLDPHHGRLRGGVKCHYHFSFSVSNESPNLRDSLICSICFPKNFPKVHTSAGMWKTRIYTVYIYMTWICFAFSVIFLGIRSHGMTSSLFFIHGNEAYRIGFFSSHQMP